MSVRRVQDYLTRLRRRRDYLNNAAEDNGHAKSELAALAWAINFIEDNADIAAEHQQKYFEGKKNDSKS